MSGELGQRIFQKPEWDQHLLEHGYAIVPFLDAAAIQRLTEAFRELHPQTPQGLYATAHSTDLAFRKQVSDLIQREFSWPCAQHLAEVQQLGGTFINKSPGPGKLEAHQDWNIVDERITRSFNVWVPLVNVTPDNGCIYILPKSHEFGFTLRGPRFPSPFSGAFAETWQLMEPLPMQAGEALVYDHRLVHASPPNQSGQDRLACVFGIIPMGAEMLYFYHRDGKVEQYRSNLAFFFEENPEQGPGSLELMGELDYDFPKWDRAFLSEKFPGKLTAPAKEGKARKKGFWGRLFGG